MKACPSHRSASSIEDPPSTGRFASNVERLLLWADSRDAEDRSRWKPS